MPARLHQKQNPSKLEEFDVLARLELVLHEERRDHIGQATPIANAISEPVSVILAHDAAPEVRLESIQGSCVTLVLNDGELGENLYPGFHVVVLGDSDVETALAIDEPGDPLSFELHAPTPNVWSLRVLGMVAKPSLRIVPMSGGL
jgi:hypothetical protein